MSKDLELFKLLTIPHEDNEDIQYVYEMGWVSNTEFFVWVSYVWLSDFIKGMEKIFGSNVFSEGLEARMLSNCICFDLCEIAEWYGFNLEEIFPCSIYKH